MTFATPSLLLSLPSLYTSTALAHVWKVVPDYRMTGKRQVNLLVRGGTFTLITVRKDHKLGDCQKPGTYKFPEGTVAQEWVCASLLADWPKASADTAPATANAVESSGLAMKH